MTGLLFRVHGRGGGPGGSPAFAPRVTTRTRYREDGRTAKAQERAEPEVPIHLPESANRRPPPAAEIVERYKGWINWDDAAEVIRKPVASAAVLLTRFELQKFVPRIF